MKADLILLPKRNWNSLGKGSGQASESSNLHLLPPADPSQCVHISALDGYQHCFNTAAEGFLCPDHQADLDVAIWRGLPKHAVHVDPVVSLIELEARFIRRGTKVHGSHLTFLV